MGGVIRSVLKAFITSEEGRQRNLGQMLGEKLHVKMSYV